MSSARSLSPQDYENERARRSGMAAGPVGADEDAALFDINLGQYVALAYKHRFVILGVFITVLMLGLALTLLSQRIYTASSTLQIDRQAARVLDADSEVEPQESMVQGLEFFETQYGLLRSRSLAERVVESLGLANSDAFVLKMGAQPVEIQNAADTGRALRLRREQVLRLVQDNLTISPVRGSRLVEIKFDSPDPVLSAQIANSFAENFIQANLDRKFESTRYLRTFLEEQIAQTKARLENAERELVAYAIDQNIVTLTESREANSGSESLIGSSLRALNDSLSQAQAQRIAAESRWNRARNAPPMSLPEVLANPAVQRLTEERAKISAEYEQQLAVYQPDYPASRQLKQRLDEIDRELASIANDILLSIRNAYNVALDQENALRAQVDALTTGVQTQRDRSVQYNILQREVDTSRTLYDGLLQRYKEIGAVSGVTTNNVLIIDTAQPPLKPSKPQLLLNLALSVLLGAGLGIAVALLLEALDETLARPEAVEQKLGLPVLGVIPMLDRDVTPLAALEDVRSQFSEAYYALRTTLGFSTPEGVPSSLLVTSGRPSEGKSTTAYAIALNLSRLGRKVLLVDGDLRNPSLHRTLQLDNARGLSTYLSGGGDLSALVQTTPHHNLSVMPCGPLPPNPAELLAGERFSALLRQTDAEYDHLVIDGPPVLGFADAPLLGHPVKGVLFVIDSASTRRTQAKGALRRMGMAHAIMLGAILTKYQASAIEVGGYAYAYDYAYGMTEQEDAKPAKARRKKK